VDIAAGFNHSLAVDFGGTVYAWGDNSYFQLGLKDAESSYVPVTVNGVKKITKVAAGNGSSLAMALDGKLYGWGYGEYGQLGNGTWEISQDTPVALKGTSACVDIACGVYHDLCLNGGENVLVWGRNNYSQIGSGKNGNANIPTRATGMVRANSYDSHSLDGVSAWAKAELEELYPKELVPPLLLENFTAPITRAELAHLLVRVYEAVESEVTVRKSNKFTDLENHPLQDDLMKAYQLDFVAGSSRDTINPDGKVTRQEAAKMLSTFAVKMKDTPFPQWTGRMSYYRDAAKVAAWAAPYVDYAFRNEIMQGIEGEFSPLGELTREQALLTVARMVKKNGWKLAS